jgi:hypothetical protein
MPFKNPHPLYGIWQGMRRRCLNPNAKQWNDYGGRGITICERWNSFHAFVQDMGPRPAGYTLERTDNDGPYSPENCRWATRREQMQNRRRSVFITVEGITYPAAELARKVGVDYLTIRSRVDRGVSTEELLSPHRLMPPAAKRKWISSKAVAGRKAAAAARTHCRKGHELTAANTYLTKQGWKQCRVCHAAKVRRQQAAKRQMHTSLSGTSSGRG